MILLIVIKASIETTKSSLREIYGTVSTFVRRKDLKYFTVTQKTIKGKIFNENYHIPKYKKQTHNNALL